MQEKKKMYRAIHRTANAGFDIWFVCAKNEIEARKIIIEKAGHGIVEFPDYQGILERYKLMIPRAALACTRRGRGFPRPSMEYGEAKKYEYTRGKSI